MTACLSPHAALDDAPPWDTASLTEAALRFSDDAGWEMPSERACHPMGRVVNFGGTAVDASGAPVEVPLHLSVVPQEGAEALSRGFRFIRPGVYEVAACICLANGEALCERASLQIDGGPPTIRVDAPGRGAMVQSAEPFVVVRGSVEDASGLRGVRIAGVELEVPFGQKRVDFTHRLAAPWGLTTVDVEAVNTCGVVATHVSSFLHSSTFGGARGASQRAVFTATQAMLQDREPNGVTLAALMELALDPELLSTHLPETFVPFRAGAPGRRLNGVMLERGKLEFADQQVEALYVQNGELYGHVVFRDVRIPFGIAARLGIGPVGVSRRVDATLSASRMSLVFRLRAAALPTLPPDLLDVDVMFESGEPHLQWGASTLQGLEFAALAAMVRDTHLVGVMSGTVQRVLRAQMHKAIHRGLSSGLAVLQWQQQVVLPEPLSVVLSARQQLQAWDFNGSGDAAWARLFIDVGVHPTTLTQQNVPERLQAELPPPRPTLGPISHGDALPEVSPDNALGVVLSDDLVNQSLWAAWAAGAFHIDDLLPLIASADADLARGLEGWQLKMFAALPPVIEPTNAPGLVRLSWGDIALEARGSLAPGAPALHAAVFATLQMHARVAIENGALVLEPSEADEHLDLFVHGTQIGNRRDWQAIGSRQLGQWMRTALRGALGRAVRAVPLPAVNVSLLPGKRSGALWQIPDAKLERAPGAVTFTFSGKLQERLVSSK